MPLICAAGRVEAVLGANANSEFCAMSGGTTGAPKVIQRRCASWIATFQLHARQFAQQTPLRYATLGDLQHSLTLYGAIEALHIGAIYHPLGGVSPRRQLAELQSARVNVLYATPTQIRLLLNVKRQKSGLEALRHVMLGGGALDQETRARLNRWAPAAEITEFLAPARPALFAHQITIRRWVLWAGPILGWSLQYAMPKVHPARAQRQEIFGCALLMCFPNIGLARILISSVAKVGCR